MSATVTVCFRIPVKADAAMRKLAKAANRSLNQQVVTAIEEHVAAAKRFGPLQHDHNTTIEKDAKGSYYAWCSQCEWMSPYRRAEAEVRTFALKHEVTAAESERNLGLRKDQTKGAKKGTKR